MHQMTIHTFSLLFITLALPALVNAQMIWPGDINNNGIVNGVDYLYWGVANQVTGPNRPDGSTTWNEQAMGSPWAQQFPQSTNYAYSDANGNGQIDANDADVISQNFGLVHGTLVPDNYQGVLPGNTSFPGMYLYSEEDGVASDQAVEVILALGSDSSFDAFYGLTFTLNYHPGILREDDGLLLSLFSGSFLNPNNTGVASFVQNNSTAGTATVTLIRTDQTDVEGGGKVARFIFNFSDLSLPNTPSQLLFSVSDVMAIDSEMNAVSIAPTTVQFTNNGNVTGGCPNTVNPVCGSNGVTYLNSCYAEADGIFSYTSGTCFDDSCIDPSAIDPNQSCSTTYEPVCGCNNITYANACAADAAGVQSTRPGACPPSNCYDPQYVVTSSSTAINSTTGAITTSCSTVYDPVCGCNGVTYTNSCLAEASGITVYTPGTCESACIDASQIDLNASCSLDYDPVCGCNGVTYPNDCRAEAAGVTSYTSGPCSGTSAWCAEAIPIQCGDFLPYETTVGAGNDILQYPGCTNTTFFGPDRVYVIEKQTAGDLQIGLEILTPGMDLDLFLLADNCSQLTCLAKSTTNNANTNNEGIILEDAPIGTYYIVVDGQQANSEGVFRLEVSCGYLYCGDAVPLQCGESYWGTNLYGHDDVSLYGCGNVRNVENNGPEIVHTFTTTEAGPVTVTLNGMTANLELFLLASCDRGDCLEYSQNSGTQSEYISEYLPAGTYYVVVDGFNGAVSDYDLLVECNTQCDFTWADLSATSSGCGQNTGSIHIASSGGTPNFLVTYSGPISGSFTTNSNSCTIYYLPPGTYTITKTDSQGCSITGTVTILGGGNLSATLTPNDAVCMSEGSIDVAIYNGQAPYHIYVNGPTAGNATANASTFNIGNLDPGDYSIHITDANGCSISQQITIDHSSGNFTWNYTVTPANCGGYGAIHVQTFNGDAPYNILVSGPVSGGATVYPGSFNLINLPGGTYQVTIEDDNWCQITRTIVIPNGNLDMSATPHPGVCGEEGNIEVNIANGDGPYWITWTGPQNGSVSTSNTIFTTPNLPAGNYTITVEDDNGCTDSESTVLNVSEDGDLSINVIPLPGSCTQNGALWIDIYSGVPNYTVSWTGPESGVLTTNEDGLDIGNLPCGVYTVVITDNNGCSGTHTVEIGGCEQIDVDLTPQNGICGQLGSILVTINGGSPTYVVSWTGPQNGQTTTATNVVNLPNLPAGTYSVQVTDANACTDYAVGQVTTTESNLNVSTTVTEAVCGSEGAIGINFTGGVGPYQVNWTGPGSGSQTVNGSSIVIDNLIAGTYTIYAVDANGCAVTITEEIWNLGSDLEVSLVGNNGICSQFGNIGVYIANGTPPYQVSWSGPQSGSTSTSATVYQIPNTPAGTYTVVIVDANGCSTSETVSVSVENNLLATLQAVDGLCGSTGSIIVNITQGSPNYTISWTGPVSGSVIVNSSQYAITNLLPGTYTVVITDNIGCTRTLTTEVEDSNGGLEINTALIYNICGQYNTIWIDIIGGTPPYTVIWEGTETSSGTTNTQSFEVMDLPPGTYKIKVLDVNGCMDMESDIIIYPSPVDLFDATPNGGICGEDGSIQINIDGGTAPYILNWNGPVSGTQSYASGGVYLLDGLPGGTYTLTLTDTNGCTETETVVIDTGSSVELITALIYNECGQYNTIWVDIVGGIPPYTITWQGEENGSTVTSTQGFEIEDLPPGTYKVTVVDANGCMDMEQGIIIYPAPIDIFTATPVAGICGEDGAININITEGTGPYTLNYTGPQSGTIQLSMGEHVLPNLPTGTYTLVLTDANGCTETEEVTVIVGGGLVELSTSLIHDECGQYNTIWLDIIGGAPPYTITWEGGQDGSTIISTLSYEIEDLPPGTYKVTVVDVNGCMDMKQGIIIFSTPVNIFSVTPIAGVCTGPGGILVSTIDGTAPYSLTWAGPQNGSEVFSGNTYTISDLPAGTYTLTMVDDNGCTENEIVTVTTTENDVNLSASVNNGSCNIGGAITAQAEGGDGTYTLTWTGPESGSATIGGVPFQIPDLSPGVYTLTVDDGNGCNDTESVTLTQPEDDLLISLTPTPGDCEDNGQIAVSIAGASPDYTISWTGPESGSVTIAGQFVILPNLLPGVYSVSVTSADGCSTTVATTLAPPEGALTIAATPIAGFCGDEGYIFLNITGGTAPWQVSWVGPESGNLTANSANVQIPGLLSGGYTITVVSGNCDGTISSILPAPAPDLEVTATPNPAICGEGGSIDISVANAQGATTISWAGPQNGSQTIDGNSLTIPNLTNGTYTITANSGNCSDITLATVQNANSNIIISANPVPAVCDQSGSINISYSGGQAPYTISWTGPSSGTFTTDATSYQISNAAVGTYTITISNGNCIGSATATVTQQHNSLGIVANPQDGNCLTSPRFLLNLSGGTPPYQLTWQGPENGSAQVNDITYSLNDVAVGLYSFTLTDVNGCTTSTTASVGDNSIDIDLSTTNGTCGDNSSITVSISNGTGPYQISWYGEIEGFATSDSPVYVIENLPGSPYTVVVQDVNGCTASDNITVVSSPTDFEVVHSVSNNGCGSLNNIWMDFFNSVGPYTIEWIGPNSGTDVTNNPYYDIENAASGVYTIIITDGTGCVDVQWVEVINIQNTLDVSFVPVNGSCGAPASIGVHIDGGTPWYTIAWNLGTQPVGEIDVNSSYYTIDDLAAGTYYVRVTDANGCQRNATITVDTPNDLLQLNPTILGPGCSTLGSIGLVFGGGNAPYSINWSGDASGSANTSNSGYIITDLNGGNYTVAVADANGCSNTLYLTVPGSTPGNLVADFDYVIDGLTVNFQNMSSNGYYFWEFGDGGSDLVAEPQYSYTAPGTYTVCLEVGGSCGSDTHCETITVAAGDNLAILDIGEAQGGPSATVQVPVTINNVQNIISLAGSIEVMSEDVALITGVTNGVIAPQYNVANNTFSYFNNTGDNLDVSPGDVLFYLNVLLLGDAGESSIIKFEQTPLPIEVGAVINGMPTVVPYTLSTGEVSIANMAALSGNLSTYWSEGILDAAVTITGPGYQETMMTNESGSYNMPDLTPGMEYTVSVEKDASANNGLSTYALFIGQRFLLGMEPPQITSPYQVIAGDANCNDAFTTLDLFLIQRLIIGAEAAFDQCPSWVFVADDQPMPADFNAYNVFPYESTSSMMLTEAETANFIGVKVGDILGEASPSSFAMQEEAASRSFDPLPFVADNPTAAAGDEVTLYFRSASFLDMVSYQFGLAFSTNQLEFLEFLPAEEQPFHTVVAGDTNAEDGKLRLSWFSLDGNGHSSSPNTTLFALKFRALTDISDWNSLLRIDPNEMLPEAYNSIDNGFEPELQFGETLTDTDDLAVSTFRLDQNMPNPFGSVTTVGFFLPEASETTFSIHDAYGQLIWQQEKMYGAGEQRLRLDQLALPAGVYYYTLRAGEQTATRSMVVVQP